MKYLILMVMMTVSIPVYADDCTEQCTSKFVNVDAQVICKQVCEVKEVLKIIATELQTQTELLKKPLIGD